jgi:hypothetical protein
MNARRTLEHIQERKKKYVEPPMNRLPENHKHLRMKRLSTCLRS